MRMGKGKGGFDHWAARMAVNQIAFEIRGNIHEQVIRDAFRLAGQKLPGRKSLDVCLVAQANIHDRSVGGGQEGRPACCGHHQVGQRHHTRRPEAAKEKAPRAEDCPYPSTSRGN